MFNHEAFRKTMVPSQAQARLLDRKSNYQGANGYCFFSPLLPFIKSQTLPRLWKNKKERKKKRRTQSYYTYFTLGIKDKELVIWLQQFARISYVDSCLLLVPCQHPDLDASFLKGFYRLGDSLLKTVFNTSST